MSFPRHAKYMDSGVDWLGQIPRHWAVKRLRFVAELNPSKSEVSHLAADTEVSFLPMEAIGEGGSLELDRVRPLADVQTGYTFFRDGDVTIAKITPCFENGKGAAMRNLCNGIGFGTTELIVARPNAAQTTSAYLQWLFTSRPFRKAGEAFMYGAGGQRRVPDDFVRDFAIGFPPLPEQRHIVTFLDNETAKIDALVEEQRRLIELLKEKRQAVISQAVTEGLNPNVPMKDSGVEWHGKVPTHWEIKQLRQFTEILRGKFTHRPRNDPAFYDGPHPFIQTGDITGAAREITSFTQTLNDRGAGVSKQFPRGTLVMTIAANIGDVAVLDFPAYFPDSIVGLVPRSGVALMFLFYLMKAMKQPLERNATVSTQMNLNVEQIGSLAAPCPPLEEQLAIVVKLDAEIASIDLLTIEAESAMSLLAERRAALISAAVTGKIDVRGLVPQPAP